MSEPTSPEQMSLLERFRNAPSPVPDLFPLKGGEQGTSQNRMTDLFPGTSGNKWEQDQRDGGKPQVVAGRLAPERLVRDARSHGIRLRRDGERLVVQAPKSQRHRIWSLLQNKHAVLAYLDTEPPPITSGRWLITGAYWEARDGRRFDWLPEDDKKACTEAAPTRLHPNRTPRSRR